MNQDSLLHQSHLTLVLLITCVNKVSGNTKQRNIFPLIFARKSANLGKRVFQSIVLAPFSAAAENIMAIKFRNTQMVHRKLNYFSLQIFSREKPTVVIPNHDKSSKQDKLF